MATAPAPKTRRRTGPKSKSSRNRTRLYLIGGALLALAVILYLRHRSSAAANPLDSSGTPGPDMTGSAAQQPSGGASSAPGNLPLALATQPDTLQEQVQQNDAGASSQQSSSTAAGTYSGYVGAVAAGTATPDQIAQAIAAASAPPVEGLPAYAPVPGVASHPGSGGSPVLNTPANSNIHRPGVQL
jgi:hypothetical protein